MTFYVSQESSSYKKTARGLSHHPWLLSASGRRMASEMGVGRNWFSESDASFSKATRKRWDSEWILSRSTESGSRKSWMEDVVAGDMVLR